MMSSSHRFTGLPGRRRAWCRLSSVGSHNKVVVVHFGMLCVASLWASCHFRCFCSVTQSMMCSFVICVSASRVLRFIQSTQVSDASSSLIAVVVWSWSSVGLLSTSLESVSELLVV